MAKSIFRRAAKTIFVSINLLMALLFLVACLSVYLNPAFWWMTGFTGLIVPYLVLFLLLFIIFWLSVKPILVLISISTLLIGWQQLYVLFAWHPIETFVKHKHADDIRIIDWNVRSFNGLAKAKQKKIVRVAVAESILRFNADILCLQEFNTGLAEDNLSLFSHQYPYHFFSQDYRRDNDKYHSGCIIFSKFPIVDSGKIKYPVAESLIYVDVVKGVDTFRVFTTHLQSFKFKKADYNDIEKIKEQEDDNLAASNNIFRKMKLAFSRRGVQAGLVRDAIDQCNYPSIICGDFNDVPNSYAYHTIVGDDRQDAFLEKSFGIGRSFIALAPSLRIDYILPDFHFDVRQFEMLDEDLSDHLMLISDIRLKK